MWKRMLASAGGAAALLLASMACCAYASDAGKEPAGHQVAASSPIPRPMATVSACREIRATPIEGGKSGMLGGREAFLLMKIAMAEAEGEDTEGKALVMRVVLNRVESEAFPDSIWEVIYQEAQFSPVADGRLGRAEPDGDCRRALDMVQGEGWDGSRGALYFESKSDSTWHEENLQYLFRHGGHYFYTDRGVGK